MAYYSQVSTGWKSLDSLIDHLRRGDNVVWQVDEIDVYRKLVSCFVDNALAENERVVYLRYGRHGPLLSPRKHLQIRTLNAAAGFESFSSKIHRIITQEGKDTFYVFDSLSDLLHEWATDRMVVNFFSVTCPYLLEFNATAYFAILKNSHSFQTIARIRETAQIFIDVYSSRGKACVHPVKVQGRYSPTMFSPHIQEAGTLVPVIDSVEAMRLYSDSLHENAVNAQRDLDYWDRLFIQAEELAASQINSEETRDKVEQLGRLILSRNKKVLRLVRKFMRLEDLLCIKERLVGTGSIGGKSLGMLLARKILERDAACDWPAILEHHDSFYIGSDLFYAYIVQNGWWKLFMAYKTKEGYFNKAAELRANILKGSFPEEIQERFRLMLEHFGRSPIIVRSSSLLEDTFDSAFAGKYESFFCVNQTAPQARLERFQEAVKRTFAGMMNEEALAYRLQRGLDRMDEHMAILVQRVSGTHRKSLFFPDLAGVGLSRNPYVWNKKMNPDAGMLRLVMGLGTRAVNRVEDDYPRIVAIDNPLVKPLTGLWDIKKYSQHYVDCLNLEANEPQTIALSELIDKNLDIDLESIAVRDRRSERHGGTAGNEQWILTFDHFLAHTPFVNYMSNMLKQLEKAYSYPVEIEFAVNYDQENKLQINLLQCRPFRAIGKSVSPAMPEQIPADKVFIQSEGNFMGGDIALDIACIIWVDSKNYAALSISEKYGVARLIGRLNRRFADRKKTPTMLMGPGRWGTQTPSMGVPVVFSEINQISVLVEISCQDAGMIPDLSFGTHFFHDLTESDIFYAAVYPENEGVVFNYGWLDHLPNAVGEIDAADGNFAHVVKVFRINLGDLILYSNVRTQKMICYRRGR